MTNLQRLQIIYVEFSKFSSLGIFDTTSSSSGLGCSGRSRYDRCGRFCRVVNGRLTDCCRVRKDFESMTRLEQQRYIRTFKTISTRQPYKRQYDRLIKMHARYFATRIHQKAEFLPWHRLYNYTELNNLIRDFLLLPPDMLKLNENKVLSKHENNHSYLNVYIFSLYSALNLAPKNYSLQKVV